MEKTVLGFCKKNKEAYDVNERLQRMLCIPSATNSQIILLNNNLKMTMKQPNKNKKNHKNKLLNIARQS